MAQDASALRLENDGSPEKLAATSGNEKDSVARTRHPRALRNHLAAFFLCLSLGFIFTLPGSFSLSSGLLGYPGDNFQHAWFLWHFARAVLHVRNPFYTHLIFAPSRVNLAWSTTDPLAGLMALPLSVFAGPVIAYNFSLILQLALAAFCARLLCLRVVRNEFAAFIGGVVFGFSPYLMAHALVHLSLVTAFPIPLFVIALDQVLTGDDPTWKRGVFLGVALLLAAFAHYNYVVMCMIFVVCFLAIESWRNRSSRVSAYLTRVWKPASLGAAIFVAGFSPMLWMMLGAPAGVPGPRLPGHIDKFSADALGFLIPSWNHVFLGHFARRMNPAIFAAGIEGTVYVGVVVLALSAIGFWACRKSSLEWAARATILGVVFWLLSLGPRIHLLGRDLHMPGPAALFFDLPFAKYISAPARFDVMIALCLAILCSLGVRHLLESATSGKGRYCIASLIVVLVVADYLTIPFPRSSTVNPGLTYSAARSIPAATGCEIPPQLQLGTILTFPLVRAPYCLKSMWMQAEAHGRFALVDGYLSYTPPEIWKPLWNIPILRSLMSIEGEYHAPVDVASDAKSGPAAVRELNLSAAVVFDSPQRDAAVAYVENVFGVKPERSGSCTIFPLQSPDSEPAESVLTPR
jgi:hypothetical protein